MRSRHLVVPLIAVMLIAAACGREEPGGPAVPQVLDIVAKDFAFEGMPEEIEGGVVEINFSNEGEVDHELALVDIGDTSFETFKEDFPAFIEGGPFPGYFGNGAVPFEIEPGESRSTTMTLPAGTYLLFCALDGDPEQEEGGEEEGDEGEGEEGEERTPHYELGMYQENVTVAGGDGDLSAPDGEIVARDYTFDLPELEAGTNRLVFRNEGPTEWHHMVAFGYPEDYDEQEATEAFEQMLEAEGEGPPPEGVPDPEEVGFTGAFSPGLGQTFELELESQRTYVFVCFIHDQAGGPPHAVAHQMYKAMTVS